MAEDDIKSNDGVWIKTLRMLSGFLKAPSKTVEQKTNLDLDLLELKRLMTEIESTLSLGKTPSPMKKSYFIIGPDFSNELEEIQALYINTNNKRTLHTFGDGKNYVDHTKIDLPQNAHVIIKGHGSLERNNYEIKLCSPDDNIATLFRQFSNSKILNVELFSCYGGSAIDAIKALPRYSTLMTFTSPSTSSLSFLQEIQNKLVVNEYHGNPFLQFAIYIFNFPDTLQFATHSRLGSEIFISSIESLGANFKDLCIAMIREWQDSQLDAFLKFCLRIQHSMNQQCSKQINKLLELLGNSEARSEWSNKFSIKQYHELLLINMSFKGNLEIVERILSIGNNISAICYKRTTPLYMAAQEGRLNVLEVLIKNGALDDNTTYHKNEILTLAARAGHLKNYSSSKCTK